MLTVLAGLVMIILAGMFDSAGWSSYDNSGWYSYDNSGWYVTQQLPLVLHFYLEFWLVFGIA